MMSIDLTPELPDLPRWRQIELSLLKEIEAGSLKVGDRLPGENALAPHFGVTRATLRRALAELQQKGVLRIEQGRGAFIERRVQYGLGPRSSFKANLRDANLLPSATIIRRFGIAAPTDIAESLRLPSGTPLFVFETIGEASGTVISLTRHHLPASRFPEAIDRVSGFSCITEVYEAFGYSSTRRAHCEIMSRLPSGDEARHLRQPRTDPILEVRSLKMARRHAIDYTVARFCAGRVSVYFDN
jgi:GntR family phosphonate transport system transcriptional regulator